MEVWPRSTDFMVPYGTPSKQHRHAHASSMIGGMRRDGREVGGRRQRRTNGEMKILDLAGEYIRYGLT